MSTVVPASGPSMSVAATRYERSTPLTIADIGNARPAFAFNCLDDSLTSAHSRKRFT